jgi:hypothetical protein
MTQLEQVALNIKDKQTELELVRSNGDIEATTQVEKEIDTLQKQYNNLKSGGDLSTFPELKTATVDPDIDQQIAYMEYLVRAPKTTSENEPHRHAILKSLLAIKTMRATGAKLMAELKTALSLPEEVMTHIVRPYDLENQMKFIEGLHSALGDPSSELQRELNRMYGALIETISVGMWIAGATADHLTRQPGNHAPEADQQIQEVNDGDLEIYIDRDQVDGSHIATFNDWCDMSNIAGLGRTPEEAVANLFKEKDKQRQGILFPEGGAHE